MKQFLLKILAFTACALILFYILDYITTAGLKKSTYKDFKEWNEIFNGDINANVIINGSSKAMVQISPKILDTILKVNSYNLGMDGHNYFLQRIKLQKYIQYNKNPQVLIQIVSTGTLNKREDLYNYQQFLPYLNDDSINKATKNYIGLNFLDYKLPVYKYFKNSNLIKIGLLSFFNLNYTSENRKYKGFYSNDILWDNSFDDFISKYPNGVSINIDSSSINLFKSDLIKLKSNGIRIILVNPPIYYESEIYIRNIEQINNIYKSISFNLDIDYFDYSNDTIKYSKKYFYNSQHLNKTGAELFSTKLAKDIQKYLLHE